MLDGLHLVYFRSYLSWSHSFDGGITVILGRNASGKTNVLEAINMLASGDSFRAEKIEEMVHWDAEVGHVAGSVLEERVMNIAGNGENVNDLSLMTKEDNRVELRVTLTRGMVQGKRVAKRKFKVNGVARRKKDFVGHLPAVLFEPDDLRLLTGSPSRRRKYLDVVLTQVDKEYMRSLWQYEQALKRRNRLLDLIREGKTARSGLAFWNRLLIEHGENIHRARETYVDFLLSKINEVGGGRVKYVKSLVNEKRLKDYESREIAAGHTLVGPHKDDFLVFDGKRDLAVYGSRGEQRMTVLWLKLMQLTYMEKYSGVRPLLLLDDIFSELDRTHDELALELASKQQTIITSTEVPENLSDISVQVIRVDEPLDLQ